MISRPGMTLSWNAENLLEEVRDDQSPFDLIESYLYDANGQRAVKTNASGVETHYINRWYEVRRESGQPDVETVHYWFGGQAVATDEDGTLRFLHSDHLGSSSVATDTNGDLVAKNTYFPYGEHRSSTGAFGTDRDFTGQRLDSGTGLHVYNARYYDSALGRFISPDSIVPDTYDPRAWNRYAYVYNNPLKYTDPDGHIPLLAWMAVGATVSAAADVGFQLAAANQQGHSGFAWSQVDWGSVTQSAVLGATSPGASAAIARHAASVGSRVLVGGTITGAVSGGVAMTSEAIRADEPGLGLLATFGREMVKGAFGQIGGPVTSIAVDFGVDVAFGVGEVLLGPIHGPDQRSNGRDSSSARTPAGSTLGSSGFSTGFYGSTDHWGQYY